VRRAASTVIVLRAYSPPTMLWAPFVLRDSAPPRWRVLTQSGERSVVIRSGQRSIDIVQKAEPLFPSGPFDLLRVDNFSPADSVDLPGMRATVVEVNEEGRPMRVHFDFDRDLEDPTFDWIVEGIGGFRRFKMPPIGVGVHLAP